MTSLENNGRPDVFKFDVILEASEGAERVPRGQGRAPPAGLVGVAAAGRPWPVGGPPGRPLVSWCLPSNKNSP